jgi:hypothetical protein
MDVLRKFLLIIPVIAMTLPVVAAGTAPTPDTLKQVLVARLAGLKPTGISERNIIITEVKQGSVAGELAVGPSEIVINKRYPFQVTLLIRDYEPGYPPNNYFGSTCVSRIEKTEFGLKLNAFGDWVVDGAMTPTLPAQCKPNPSAGVSSIPLASLGK